ncbi:MAG TPA: chemotaxis response regulator protein-glutamate methylesterase [Gemmataceae bacterium]|jgi:two-component system response regulator WspF
MRVAIVNDLALAREVLRRLVQSVPGYTIAWAACNGAEAVRLAAADRPDAILMDLVMPIMDGVEATRRIMAETPCPILLVTSSICGNFDKVYEAMGHGGLDAVNTPTFDREGKINDGEGLLARLDSLAKANRVAPAPLAPPTVASRPAGQGPALVAVGASTGGPEALARILEAFPADFPAAVVIIQHIGADFAPSLVRWLGDRTRLPVRLAKTGDTPTAGVVLVAGSNDHLRLDRDHRLFYTPDPTDYPYRPSVDEFFCSLTAYWPRRGVAALLTGMGSDGARGLLQLRQAGWMTFAQDQATSIVYGMPHAAAQLGAASQVLPLSRLAPAILAEIGKEKTLPTHTAR